ncbi:hypothetical protein P7C70_g4377, partial [Phenoliferia sp. Uapishka_3]
MDVPVLRSPPPPRHRTASSSSTSKVQPLVAMELAPPTLESWLGEGHDGFVRDEYWVPGPAFAEVATSRSESGNESATVGERIPGRRKSVSGKGRTRVRSIRSRSAGESWGKAQSLRCESLFAFDVAYAKDISSSEESSPTSSTYPSSSSSSVSSSMRSSPEPSECEFFPGYRGVGPLSSRTGTIHKSVIAFVPPASTCLSRRHTLPRRKRVRAASISITFEAARIAPVSPLPSDDFLTFPSIPPITTTATVITLALLLFSLNSSSPLLPTSPIHLLHPRGHFLLESANAAFSPFLTIASTTAISLSLSNLAGLKTLEDEGTTGVVMVGLWGAIVAVRVLLAWLFGRVLGWAHPQFFSTEAIHEVGGGLAPLLLALYIISAYGRPATKPDSLFLQIALLSANFSTPVRYGGTGLWWGVSAMMVGFTACLGLGARQLFAPFTSETSSKSRVPALVISRLSPLLPLVFLPFLATSPTLSSQNYVDTSFASLHPQQSHLLTILLLTAPRPGNPDFLLKTIESWLGALPTPTSSPTSPNRIRLIVYTHFLTHDRFDYAQQYFTSSPKFAVKSALYVEWRRDPRGSDRLDQRLHVARGLDYASHAGGESAYVLLTEDDFPLCPNGNGAADGWSETWDSLKRALVDTNDLMPDFTSDPTSSNLVNYASQEASSGHCGLFLATGGSGLAIRGFIAGRLSALLLGATDADGAARDARASAVRKEDEGADTPDLVIQDCLRGRIPGCEVCAPDPTRLWPHGSRRKAQSAQGDRWGKSGLAGTKSLMQMHLGFNASTLPGRRYGKEEWACGWRQPFNGEPDVLTV